MRKTFQRASLASALTLVLLLLTSVIRPGFSGALAGQDRNDGSPEHHGYSAESINGSYAFIGTYAGLVASSFGVVTFNGAGGVKGTLIVNQPNPDGSRSIVNVGIAGTYSVNPDGTGTNSLVVTLPGGHTANVTEDLIIRKAEVDRGVLTATSIFEAQEEPSVVLSGAVYVTHTYTRRPD